jgi:hypothetical protein
VDAEVEGKTDMNTRLQHQNDYTSCVICRKQSCKDAVSIVLPREVKEEQIYLSTLTMPSLEINCKNYIQAYIAEN